MVIYLGKRRIFTANWTNIILSAHAQGREKAGTLRNCTKIKMNQIKYSKRLRTSNHQSDITAML